MNEDHPAMKELLTADVPEGALPTTTILHIRILTAVYGRTTLCGRQ